MENSIKALIVEAIAQYNAIGSQAIDEAYAIYSQNTESPVSLEAFESIICGENNSNMQEIDSISFMYDAESEQWASEEEMIAWYDANIKL